MSNLAKDLKTVLECEGGHEAVAIKNRMERLFLEDRDDQDRYGLHASAILDSEEHFCYRAQLLSLFFRQNQGKELPINVLKIFAQGNAMHEKWYKLFRKAGIDVAIERTLFLPEYDLSFTIDALLSLFGKEYICDVKSQNSFQFGKMKGHPHGESQINFYMWALTKYTGVPHRDGFVLVDNKDTSDIKIVPVHWCKEKAAPYIERLKDIQDMKNAFLEEHEVPPRCGSCTSCDCKRAKECGMRDACWNVGLGRRKLTPEERSGPGKS